MTCIFCDNKIEKNSEEHIVPESLGNILYILKPLSICGTCNNSFSKFEDKALSKTILGFERARLGVKTKKGKPAAGQVEDIKFTANSDFKKNYITMEGVTEKDILNVNQEEKTFQVLVKGFDNNSMSTSKLILKIGLESIYQSQAKIYNSFDFTELKRYLTNKDNLNWPFVTTSLELSSFKSVPTFYDKHCLNFLHCNLTYSILNGATLLFKFRYGGAKFIINLLGRNTEWTKEYLAQDKQAILYPEKDKK